MRFQFQIIQVFWIKCRNNLFRLFFYLSLLNYHLNILSLLVRTLFFHRSLNFLFLNIDILWMILLPHLKRFFSLRVLSMNRLTPKFLFTPCNPNLLHLHVSHYVRYSKHWFLLKRVFIQLFQIEMHFLIIALLQCSVNSVDIRSVLYLIV